MDPTAIPEPELALIARVVAYAEALLVGLRR